MKHRRGERKSPRRTAPATTARLRRLVEQTYRQYGAPLRLWLHKCYPRTDHALVEDAVSESFVHALERPELFTRAMQRGGETALRQLFRLIAWRNLRGHLRRKAWRLERTGVDSAEPLDAITPQQLVSGRETATRVFELVEVAATRFGGSRSAALRTALHERLAGGTDTEVARAHGVPREYVNRAKLWIGSQLDAA